jgi:transposase-like protein
VQRKGATLATQRGQHGSANELAQGLSDEKRALNLGSVPLVPGWCSSLIPASGILGLTTLRREAEDPMDGDPCSCPTPVCPFDGGRCGERRLVKKGTTRGRRQAWGRACGRSSAWTSGTPSVAGEQEPALCELALRALAEGHASRATARILQVDQEAVGPWRDRAAPQGRLVRR